MRLDLDRQDRIARAARTLLALAGQLHLRAGLDPGGELEVERLAVCERHALRLQRRRLDERHLQAIRGILALGLRAPTEAAGEPAAAATLRAAEQPFEDVAHVGPAGAALIAFAAEAAAGLRSPAATAAKAERRRGVAVAVDLAAIEPRALVLVVQQVVRVGDRAEPLRRLRIVLVAIGMKLLRELAVRLLDVGFGRVARYTQSLVRIGHLRPHYTLRVYVGGSPAQRNCARGVWLHERNDHDRQTTDAGRA